jgi:hypothetical protein
MKPKILHLLSLLLAFMVTNPSSLPGAAPEVTLTGGPGEWTLKVNGEPFFIRGVAGYENLHHLRAIGGNTIRTYTFRNMDPVLEEAAAAGIKVVLGFWLGHERHGFSYTDSEALERQRNEILENVKRLRDNPQIIIWALGNEMEEDGSNLLIWEEIEKLAQAVKAIDNRPVATIIAGPSPVKIRAIRDHCPSIDIVGINAYAALPRAYEAMRREYPERPFLITEFGALGPWERPRTPWGAEIEQTSREKARGIQRGWEVDIEGRRGWSLGGFAFRWGWKQEATHTWFSLILKSGFATEAVDALYTVWKGHPPETPAPSILGLDGSSLVRPLSPGDLRMVSFSVPEGSWQDHWEVVWEIYQEGFDRRRGGDFEQTPPRIEGFLQSKDTMSVEITAPPPGNYRLFLTLLDHQTRKAATANIPFQSQP